MRKITQQNLHNFCRTCLVELTDASSIMDGKYSIQENELEELINVCASMRAEADLTFPEFVCGICYEKLQSLQEFRCQTMHSLGLLSNICKKLKENRATPGLNTQTNEVKLEDEVYVEAREYFNSTQSGEIMHNSINRPATQAITNQCKNDISNDVPVSDIKIEPSEYLDCFDYLGTPKDNTNAHNAEDVSPSPYDNVYQNIDYEQSNNICSNLSKRTNIQDFICNQCSRRFTNFENYEAHLRIHKGLKPYVCNVCGQGFSRSDRQRTHIREVHSTVMPQYKCLEEGCGKVFNREDTYKKHIRCKHKHQKSKPKTLRQALWQSLFTA